VFAQCPGVSLCALLANHAPLGKSPTWAGKRQVAIPGDLLIPRPFSACESASDQQNTRCWEMAFAHASAMKAQISRCRKPTVDKIVAVESLQEHQESTGCNRGAGLAVNRHCRQISCLRMVGAGRFERPTPCAQGGLAGSKPSIGSRLFLTISTIWGICFRSIRNPGGIKNMRFGHSCGTWERRCQSGSVAGPAGLGPVLPQFCHSRGTGTKSAACPG